MITDRDIKIINFIYDFKFITISQCGDIFFPNNKSKYDGARHRLKKIEKTKRYIKHIFNEETKEKIYIPIGSKEKKIKMHRIKLIDYIAALSSIGAKIKTIEIEPNFNNIKPDAYITFVFDKKLFHQLIEIELRHDYVDINRFKPVLGYILQKTNNVRPTIVIIQDTNKDYNTDNFTGLQVIQLNTKLREIAKVININR